MRGILRASQRQAHRCTAFGGRQQHASLPSYAMEAGAGKDETLVEGQFPTRAGNCSGANQADVGVSAEPFISQGVGKGVWGFPSTLPRT